MTKLLKLTVLCAFLMAKAYAQSFYVFEQEGRIKDGDPYYEHSDISYNYKINEHWTPFVGYRFIVEDKGGKTGVKDFSRFLVGFNYTEEGKYGKLAFRTRAEFTPGHEMGNLDAENDYRIRERIRYDLPYSWTKFKLTPFVYDEVFFDMDAGFDFTRNRVGGGFAYRITKHIYGDLYYFHESKQSGAHWVDADIGALIVRYRF